jgi:predicted phage baseplate assembly protein
VVGYQRLGGEIVHPDYRDGLGVTIRFGDGEFGQPPRRGSPGDPSLFEVTYRLGNGKRGNLPAGAIAKWDTADPMLANVTAVMNPLPTSGGVDPETAEDVKKLAPDAFRARTYRAVRPEDYAEEAERLPWVQRAGAAFRWTGSWLSAFVTADPLDAVTVSAERRAELTAHLDRVRQAGREVFVLEPKYADLDLAVKICVAPTAYPGDVIEAVLVALFGKDGLRPVKGFFHPDNFTFGTPLDRSELEAAIQAVPGVKAVEYMIIRRRGWFGWKLFVPLVYKPAQDEVIRVMNDRTHPDRGSLRLFTEGGA